MFISCIRGAITVDKNTKEQILEATQALLEEIIKANNIDINEILFILFTSTKDLDKVYPAVAARNLGITEASLMCTQEMYVEGSLNLCIRVMVQIQSNIDQKNIKHIYLKNAAVLRPDLN